jgi:very-short-patch-repair endonuclease
MLREDLTFQKYSYSAHKLTAGSNKHVIVECDYCGEIIEVLKKNWTYGRKHIEKDCCKSCAPKKREEISIARYGVKNSMQRPEVRAKLSNINWEAIKSEVINLCNKGFSITYISEKLKLPYQSLVKYVHDWVPTYETDFTTAERKEISVIDKYEGKDNYNEIRRKQIKKTSIKKYGVEHPFQLQEIKDKIRRSRIESGNIKEHKGKNISDWAKEKGFSREHMNRLVNRHGFDNAVKISKYETNIEALIREMLDNANVEYKTQKGFDKKYIADFVIEKNKLVIEADGNYWHSDAMKKDRNYHKNKRDYYIKNGYRPLFFRGDEIENKSEIVKSMIFNRLELAERKIQARKCEFMLLEDKELAKDFFNKNHLMGKGAGDTYILSHEGTIVAALCIKLVSKKEKKYEISRFATALNTSVAGGFSKLLKNIEACLDMWELVTFLDLRYSGNGEYLRDLGFESKNPNLSFKWTDGYECYGRMTYPGDSGYDLGYYKLWDCGQQKFVKQY